MGELILARVGDAQALLAEAIRTTDSTPESMLDRFIEIRPGVERELLAKTNHLLTGRRGVGKSTLLFRARVSLRKVGTPVVSIDMESFKNRAYPDVLIEIVLRVLSETTALVRPSKWIARMALFRTLKPLFAELNQILGDPLVVQNQVTRERSKTSEGGLGGTFAIPADVLKLSATFKSRRINHTGAAQRAEYELSKDERIRALIPQLNSAFRRLISESGKEHGLIFLDDFYYVGQADQAMVLDFIHRAVKGSGYYLKVGGLGTRLQPFKDGDPPIGMQVGHDISRLALDVTLTDFNTAKRFLEDVVEGILAPLGVTVGHLLTDDARDRMVLASGGAVARDYITLLKGALEKTIERLSQDGPLSADAAVRVRTADVQKTMSLLTTLREEDSFKVDALSDADALRERWRHIARFTKNADTVFILVPQAVLDDRRIGREISQLEQLRLLHRIKETTANSVKWKGQPMVAYMTDLGAAAQQRLRVDIPPFWRSNAESEKLRRASWVYSPDLG
ncbi:hypothetical protein [Cryobacterium sp. BB736]|uniref:hypothetical protein n=1 Tax=Cryobacterium sp. BB736 TaxID=2746963 RepID=UPI001874DFEB|nr:hypothetical protein [Cryobacterium sp. BB736]